MTDSERNASVRRRWPVRIIAVSLIALIALAACDDEAAVNRDIRQENLAAQPGVEEIIAGDPATAIRQISYADLTRDGVEEAVAHVLSESEREAAVFVFGYVDGELREMLRQLVPRDPDDAHIQGLVEDGQLVIQWPIYNEGDEACCPTGGYRRHFFEWNGSSLVLERAEAVESLGE